jgi:DNA repair protein RadD
MKLRPYQERVVEQSINWMLKSTAPFVIEAATGAGKSIIISEVAKIIHHRTGKRVLCLAPNADLVKQNIAKYKAYGLKASVFSASAGAKDLRHPVVFGTPKTVLNRIARFKRQGDEGYALVICDEAHGLTPTIKTILAAMRESNSNLRIMGLTATPYRLGSGYIYTEEPDGSRHGEDRAREPYFLKCVERIDARELIDQGYLTQPVIGHINAEGYDTSGLTLNSRGQFDAAAVDRAYLGHGRKTSAIVADVVNQSRDRKGVMFFAATVAHAQEILASLPPEMSRMIGGDINTGIKQRAVLVEDFKKQKFKYLVSVATMTTGVDFTHVDVIAILRKTESVGLLQQIIGRGLRIHPDKQNCLVLDYTTNLTDHCPDGDLFSPIIKAGKAPSAPGGLSCLCPECGYENNFTVQPQVAEAGYRIDANGYCLDLDGVPVMTEYGPMPAHFGRRCWGQVKIPGTPGNAAKQYERCGYRWTGKACPHCGEKNDIAARYCYECKGEIVDPNEKLAGEFRAMKRDPTQTQTDKVLTMTVSEGISARGNRTIRADYVTPYRSFSIWYQPDAQHTRGMAEWAAFCAATDYGKEKPSTLTYRKNAQSGFYQALGYNREPDALPGSTEKMEGYFDATA